MEMDLRTETGFADACRWVRHHLARIREGGCWIIPRSGYVLRVTSHRDKTAVRMGTATEPLLEAVMTTLGWLVTKE